MISLIFIINFPLSASNSDDTIYFVTESWQDATNSDGTGIYWDILRKVYNPKGIKISFKIVPYERSVKMIQHQKADAAIGTYEDEIEEAIYPKWHFDADQVVAIFKKNLIKKWQGESSIANKKVVWIRGYAYDEYLNVSVKKYEVDLRKSALLMLQNNRVDFFLDAIYDLQAELDKGYFDYSHYQIEDVIQLNLYLAFANNERGKKFRKIFDEQFSILLKSGEIKRLYEQWDWGFLPFPDFTVNTNDKQ